MAVIVRNLSPNPSAENNDGWLSNNGAVYPRVIDTDRKHSGNQSIRSENRIEETTAMSLYSVGAIVGSGFPPAQDGSYIHSVWVYCETEVRGRLGVSYRVSDVYHSPIYSDYISIPAHKWTKIQGTFVSFSSVQLLRTMLQVVRIPSEPLLPAGTRVWADSYLCVAELEDVPYFDGDSGPILYKGQIVYPKWDGTPNESTSSFEYTPKNFEARDSYQTGISQGVLYPKNAPAVPWNGLIAVDETFSGGTHSAHHYDGFKYLDVYTNKHFQANVRAYSYPNEMSPALGEVSVLPGFILTRQQRETFDFAYKTNVGPDHSRLHLVYNASILSNGPSYSTQSDSTTPAEFSWTINTVAPPLEDHHPSAHLIIDYREATSPAIEFLEMVLFGGDTSDGVMIQPEVVKTILEAY